MTIKPFIISAILVIFTCCIEAKPPELTPSLTHKKSEEILKAHVIHKEFSSEISKRTLKNYIAELDPTKTYFLVDEISQWENPSEELIEDLKREYKRRQFAHFEDIYRIMLSAIERRNRLEQKIALTTSIAQDVDVKALDFKTLEWAKDENELERRLLQIRHLQVEAAKQLELEAQDRVIQHLTKMRLNREQEILQGEERPAQTKQMLVYFLKSFSSALDNHTAYFTPIEANQFMTQVQQCLLGIGVELRDNLSGFTLVRLLEGGPALRGGRLKVGDKIIAVNHEPVVGISIIEVVNLIRGPKGSFVSLTILREREDGGSDKFDVDVMRDEIFLKESCLESENIPYGDGVIAHVRLFSFYKNPHSSSASDIKNTIEKIRKEHSLHGIILDLRGNAGGLLPQAVEVVGLFIKKGIVVSVKDNNGGLHHLRNFNGSVTWDGPLLILTNKESASSAEIVAQSLRDYCRAILVGDHRTWGKGSYQTFTLESGNMHQINPQGEYKVTRGIYYTVSGKSPQGTGTRVDIEVPGNLAYLEIGEDYSKFPLGKDEISPNFADTLGDIHPLYRIKMMRYYRKDLQQREDLYLPYLETLKHNSAMRIKGNCNYQNFLKGLLKRGDDVDTIEQYGQNDLQLEEAYSIMKDLIFLTREHVPSTNKAVQNSREE